MNARRTGLAHVFYNLLTGVAAFVFLPLFIGGWGAFAPDTVRGDPEIALVAFHTMFNAMGVLVVLPFTAQFARLIVTLVPSSKTRLTWRLDPTLLNEPAAAVESVEGTIRDLATSAFKTLAELIENLHVDAGERLDRIDEAVEETRIYLSQIQRADHDQVRDREQTALHVLDHLSRLLRRCHAQERLSRVRVETELTRYADELAAALQEIQQPPDSIDSVDAFSGSNSRLEPLWNEIDRRIEPHRREMLERAVEQSATIEDALSSLDSIRWLRRVIYHTWRIANHLDRTVESTTFREELEPNS